MEQESQQAGNAPEPANTGREVSGQGGGNTAALEQRARLAVTRNIGLATIVGLGCVLIVLLVFNRPLVYRIFPWSEPGLEQVWPTAPTEVKLPVDQVMDVWVPVTEADLGPGVYTAETADGMQIQVVDPTLRPDLYLTIEFTYACGCPGSFIPAYEGPYEQAYPERAKAQREKLICFKCRKALEYLEDKEKAAGDKSGEG